MKKVIFYCNWNKSPKELLEKKRKQTKENSGIWEDIEGTDNPDLADIFVIFDSCIELNGKYTDRTKIVMQREPEHVQSIEKLYKTEANIYTTYSDGFHLFSTWWIDREFNDIENMEINKSKKISAIMSNKTHFPGHVARHSFLKTLSNRFCSDIDIYGLGLSEGDFSGKYRGPLISKINGLLDYEFSIAMENGIRKNYFSEKICDCFLTMTKPIYWGCPNLSDFFPDGSYFNIDINDEKSIQEIEAICSSGISASDTEAMKEAKNLVLYKYNLWPSIKRVVDSL